MVTRSSIEWVWVLWLLSNLVIFKLHSKEQNVGAAGIGVVSLLIIGLSPFHLHTREGHTYLPCTWHTQAMYCCVCALTHKKMGPTLRVAGPNWPISALNL
jgi:hypothetical protein